MKISRLAMVIGAAFAAAFASVAIAQVPQVSIINPNDLVQVIPNGQPSAQSRYALPKQITSQMGYQKQSPVTGFAYTFANSDSLIVLTHTTTLAAGTITFAAAPSDGAEECVYAQNIVTALALVGGTSAQTIQNAVTTIGAAARVCYLYSLSNQTWNRSQ